MSAEVLEDLKQAILEYEADEAASLARQAIAEGVDPMSAMDALTEAIRQVGDGFGAGDLFLPDLVGAAEAMQRAVPVLEEAFKGEGKERQVLGVVVIGTVAGDIHTIGKSMVATLLTAEGFAVHDLGINVPTDKFIEAVKEHQPSILAMSALLTTTAPEAKKVIDTLAEAGLRDEVKIMVGGGAITEAFAKGMGADGYDPPAPGAVEVAKDMLQI